MTKPPTPSSRNPDVTPFCCALYAAPDVSEIAIMLQDAVAVDVNILLYLCWRAGFADGQMDSPEIARLMAAATPLQEETVKPLRQARRTIPKGSDREPERQQLLELELAAEKAELEMLASMSPHELVPVQDEKTIHEAARANMASYVALLDKEPQDEVLRRIAEQAATLHTKTEKAET